MASKLILTKSSDIDRFCNNVRKLDNSTELKMWPDDIVQTLSQPYQGIFGKMVAGQISNLETDKVSHWRLTGGKTAASLYILKANIGLNRISLPNCISITLSLFQNYSGPVREVTMGIESVPVGAFKNMTNLEYLYLPNCGTIGRQALANCINLHEINFPLCRNIESQGCAGNENLSFVSLPACTYIGSQAFTHCAWLQKVYIPDLMSVGNRAFAYIDSTPECEFYFRNYLSYNSMFYSTNTSVMKMYTREPDRYAAEWRSSWFAGEIIYSDIT